MKRREFILGSAGMAGALTPLFGRAAVPCPPPSVSIAGGTTAVTACVPTGSGTYSTDFDGTENPISEGGRWAQNGRLTGLDWSDMRTANGIAYGTQVGDGARGYDDSMALLSGFSPNQRITATVHFTGNRTASTGTHEILLLLRGTIAPHSITFYVATIGYHSESGWALQMGRIMGGWFDSRNADILNFGGGLNIRNGDTLAFQIMGSTIQLYQNGSLLTTAQDSAIASGNPGIGAFWRGTESPSDFAFARITAENI